MCLSHDPTIWLLWNMVRTCIWIFQWLHKLLLSSWQGRNSDTALYPTLLLNIYTPVKHIKLAACAHITARWRSRTQRGSRWLPRWADKSGPRRSYYCTGFSPYCSQYFREKSRRESELSSFGIRLSCEIAVSKYGHSLWKDERERFKPNNDGCHIIPVKSTWKWNPDLLRNVSI